MSGAAVKRIINKDIKEIHKNSLDKQGIFIEFNEDNLLDACRYLKDPKKHFYLLSGPLNDADKNPYVIRYNKAEDIHYLASEKDGKKTKWTAVYDDNEWREQLKK